MTKECIGCGADTVKKLIDLGPQQPGTRYLSETKESYNTHPIEFCLFDRFGSAYGWQAQSSALGSAVA
ncbi:hypothetical protein OA871_02845 [Paracoccaceae bacterium]|nr:hypothetical protein [Paracoccaceae bacterium]